MLTEKETESKLNKLKLEITVIKPSPSPCDMRAKPRSVVAVPADLVSPKVHGIFVIASGKYSSATQYNELQHYDAQAPCWTLHTAYCAGLARE